MADEAKLTEFLDREAIRDCIYRYCRGIDRADEATLRSSYWPDATDRHGVYSGPVEGFFLWAREVFKSGARNVHQVGNILIELVGPTRAAVETYFLALQRGPGKDGVVRQFFIAGRYCDLFEKRGGEWRVARRIVAFDWLEEQAVPTESEEVRFGPRMPIGAPHPNDPIHEILAEARRT
ncbi:nuclear transport factor 2 family protein [Bradyrhizobium sp. CCGUVB1N3]|uniref:nuclear transport factor 2 family protein n=1 Tax=Bradyrhizobium sp. CCGUVB1N3 TaxID=2949629 RepID=UPI0020B1E444|nr:nuclear transport factor 2 family protein [Bradyrhizobium sp. CCGUVB1N3]MCP3468820.1 nuclear transport factor 2 family protein [Bradyrhizobium sp. CCGUVB1N3]